MSSMEPSTASQGGRDPILRDPVPVPRTNATQAGKIAKPYGDRYHKPRTVPDLVGPDFPFPAPVAKLFRKIFRRKDAPAAR
jgi:hypothetical protein